MLIHHFYSSLPFCDHRIFITLLNIYNIFLIVFSIAIFFLFISYSFDKWNPRTIFIPLVTLFNLVDFTLEITSCCTNDCRGAEYFVSRPFGQCEQNRHNWRERCSKFFLVLHLYADYANIHAHILQPSVLQSPTVLSYYSYTNHLLNIPIKTSDSFHNNYASDCLIDSLNR